MTTSEGFGVILTQLGWDATHDHIPYPHRDIPETEEWVRGRGGILEIGECERPGAWVASDDVREVRP